MIAVDFHLIRQIRGGGGDGESVKSKSTLVRERARTIERVRMRQHPHAGDREGADGGRAAPSSNETKGNQRDTASVPTVLEPFIHSPSVVVVDRMWM